MHRCMLARPHVPAMAAAACLGPALAAAAVAAAAAFSLLGAMSSVSRLQAGPCRKRAWQHRGKLLSDQAQGTSISQAKPQGGSQGLFGWRTLSTAAAAAVDGLPPSPPPPRP